MVRILGWEIRRSKEELAREQLPSFAPPVKEDGAISVEATGASFATYVDLDGTAKTESELITRYRTMAQQTEIDAAIQEIIGDAIVSEEESEIVELNFEDVKDNNEKELPENVQKKIEDEFDNVLGLMDFNQRGYKIFRDWYIDARLYFHVIVDETKPQDGIQELRWIDARKIRKIREIKKVADPTGQYFTVRTVGEYYIYNEQGFGGEKAGFSSTQPMETKGLKIAKDSIAHVSSGLTDVSGKMVLGYLYKAIKPLNQLRAVEDAAVIYRLVRAPERRVFYIDVGNLPKSKADQYMRNIMTRHKNRLVYDADTGKIKDDRKFMTAVEDYWLPRSEGGKGTEIDTLKGGENLNQMDDVNYFLKRLYRSLRVPLGRLDAENTFSLDIKATGITREEVTFSRFIDQLRAEFSSLFLQLLEKQLILKQVCTPDDWKEWGKKIRFKWARDNFFAEAKEQEVMLERSTVLKEIGPYVGLYYSHEWVRKHVCRQSDEDIRENDKQIEKEKGEDKWQEQQLPGQIFPEPADPGAVPPGPDTGPPQLTPTDTRDAKVRLGRV